MSQQLSNAGLVRDKPSGDEQHHLSTASGSRRTATAQLHARPGTNPWVVSFSTSPASLALEGGVILMPGLDRTKVARAWDVAKVPEDERYQTSGRIQRLLGHEEA